ncbi:septum formation initiator [Campylobacter sp. 19-13652]|uniref:septum formation initiator n=1 Tax=Campylobacter sp. 19-13652 TaxID=2840180 RepID=UPI001C7928CA|nr:septum formation initiator [Campylobacter sp. 19-13652]BCX80142.1 hypothetical protein LBC_16040 [Campylobacter sp. 19-13652]
MSEELLKGYDEHARRGQRLRQAGVLALAAFVTIMLGIYFGGVFFGARSLEVMLALQGKKEQLKSDIEQLKQENAALQKKYFELKMLFEAAK